MLKNTWMEKIEGGALDSCFETLYGAAKVDAARLRYTQTVNTFCEIYGDGDLRIFSAPGRTEISGNHTDHNNGVVVAASVNLDIIAVVKATDDNIVTLKSKGFDKVDTVDLTQLQPAEDEEGHSASLIRGISRCIKDKGGAIGGFTAYTTNDVLRGSGLSSSAAFEVCIGQIINSLYNDDKFTAVEIAQIGQYAENVYFGKPSGLLDQTACAVGGVIKIDFVDKEKPQVERVDFDIDAHGLELCITDTGGDHADLTHLYASIPVEMRSVADFMGETVLRDVERADIIKKLPDIRQKLGDRAVLRALHFYDECERADATAAAIRDKDMDKFFSLITASGHSSFEQVQNAYNPADEKEQNIPISLAVSANLIGSDGACRLQGGGFAGTIQAFVPKQKADAYAALLDSIFGEGSCHRLLIRSVGICEVKA